MKSVSKLSKIINCPEKMKFTSWLILIEMDMVLENCVEICRGKEHLSLSKKVHAISVTVMTKQRLGTVIVCKQMLGFCIDTNCSH